MFRSPCMNVRLPEKCWNRSGWLNCSAPKIVGYSKCNYKLIMKKIDSLVNVTSNVRMNIMCLIFHFRICVGCDAVGILHANLLLLFSIDLPSGCCKNKQNKTTIATKTMTRLAKWNRPSPCRGWYENDVAARSVVAVCNSTQSHHIHTHID